MKKIFLTMVSLTIMLFLFAQSPQTFKYQAVARNSSGDILANQNVSFQMSIIQGSAGGTAVYSETFNALTNEYGLVNLKIGTGNVIFGVFEEIEWGGDGYFLQTEMDDMGGTNFQLMGTSQLLSVPYANYAATTGDTSTWQKEADDIYYKNGKVGIGTNSPGHILSANGIIESTTDGFMFPDGSVQSTAALSSQGGTSDTIVFGGPATAAEKRGFVGMLVDGIAGSWEWGLGCEECSAVFDLDWSIYQPYDAGGLAGVRQHNVMTVYKNIDRASVLLLQRFVNSTDIDNIQFRFYWFNPIISNYEIYYTVTLEHTKVVYFNHDVYHTGNGEMAHMDQVSFLYQTIIWEWLDGGIQYQDDWGAWPPVND